MRVWAASFLLVLGLMQMVGDLFGLRPLVGLGMASGASPAPKVFSAVGGLETYSTRFLLQWTDADGKPAFLPITPELYSRIRGPYNRRNVYGAALAYGPVLPAELRAPVMRYALCGEAPLLRELGLDPNEVRPPIRIVYEPVSGTDLGSLERVLETTCH